MNLSDKIQIVRDGKTFGPYTVAEAYSYFERGLLFEHDLASESGNTATEAKPLRKIFKKAHIRGRIFPAWKQQVSLVSQNHTLLFPLKYLVSKQWFADKKTVLLMTIGCTPLLLVVLDSTLIGYFGLAAYFSMLWAVFFFSQFKTPQTVVKESVTVFCLTPLLAFLLISISSMIPPFPFLHAMADSEHFLLCWTGMFLAVALVEEICKALPVFWLVSRPGRVLQPRTVMLYGMISGLGFGIWEGVAYQMGINRDQGVDQAYFYNVLRLTSLPFIHSVWAGISSYFIGFSMLLPVHRWNLRVIAILLPALIHATHNTFLFLSIVVDLLSVLLLMSYLGNGQTLFNNLKKNTGMTP